jgi:hypothetical protein
VKSYAETLYSVASRTIKSESWYFLPGLSWPRRSYNFISQIVPSGVILTHGKSCAFFNSNHEIAYCCSYWNSKYFDYLVKLSLGSDESPQFEVGIINKSPLPNFSDDLKKILEYEALINYNLFLDIYNRVETSLYFNTPPILSNSSIKDSIESYLILLNENKKNHSSSLSRINKIIYEYFELNENEILNIEEIIDNQNYNNEGKAFDLTYISIVENIFSWLLGVAFGRWDVRFSKNPEWIPIKEDIFSAFPISSPGSLINTLLLPATNDKIVSSEFISQRKYLDRGVLNVKNEEVNETLYPIPVLWHGIGVVDQSRPDNLIKILSNVLSFIWDKNANSIENELTDLLNVRDLYEWINNPNKFFTRHLSQYTQNKRISPIYWPISTASGSYTIWLYYPKLTDQTLVAVINNYLQPKIDEVIKEKKPLELNSILDNTGLKKLKELNDFEHELEEMKKELLRITALPYKPNHDDGVLITAAPLYRLFRHTKWRKATDDCWRELEKGEYDWAHLAYSIWPDRVTKKCKKDLSMAIAHGIENICEVKPKEKKEKVEKVAKKSNPINELNFGE